MRKIAIILVILTLVSCILLSGCQESDKITASTPAITWYEKLNAIVIESVSENVYYNSDTTTNNIMFIDLDTDINFYVNENLDLTDSLTSLSIKKIEVGDEINGFFTDHNYKILWSPTDNNMGELSLEEYTTPVATFGMYDENENVTLSVTIISPQVPWSDINCILRDLTGGTEQSWDGIGIDKETGDGIIDYEVIDDGDGEVSLGDIIKFGYNTNPADNIIEGNSYSFSITYKRTGEVAGSLGWYP